MKKYSSKIAVVLIISILLNITMPNSEIWASGQERQDKYIETLYEDEEIAQVNELYYEGESYVTYIDAEKEQHVEQFVSDTSDEIATELVLDENGIGKCYVSDENSTSAYDLKVRELNEECVDVEIYQDGKLIKHITDISELEVDTYEGQMATSFLTVLVYSVVAAIAVVVTVRAVIYVGSVLYESLSKVYDDIREIALATTNTISNRWYRAKLDCEDVFIDFANPMPITSAASRISQGLNTYAFFASDALGAVVTTGRGYVGAEIDTNKKSGRIYYYHYHTADRNGAHSWFGAPYTK